MGKQKYGVDSGELERIQQIKRLVVTAMFSDDDLMERFVLKGGNAIDLAFEAGTRASADIDLSMAGEFRQEELADIRARIERNLISTFRPNGFEVFDFSMAEAPEDITPDLRGFWGGYTLSFKIIEAAKYKLFVGSLEHLRRNALMIGRRGRFEIDISRFEYCADKTAKEMEGLRIFVYTPEMVVCEKLRALCQQMPAYGPVVKRNRAGSARARDFVDIHKLVGHFKIEINSLHNRALLQNVFDAKRVPVSLLESLPEFREFHRSDFDSVKATVKAGITLKDFDYYFNFVVGLVEKLKPFGNV
jgi:predicted nucleotidyltransferase component of viral defense system